MPIGVPVDRWVDEKGKGVEMLPGFSLVYVDEKAVELGKKFMFCDFKLERRGSELGSAEMEDIAANLLLLCKFYNMVVGFGRGELEAYAEWEGTDCHESELPGRLHLRSKWVRGVEAYFPTEELLNRFGVPRR